MFDTFLQGLPRAGHAVGTPSAVPQLSWTRPRVKEYASPSNDVLTKVPGWGVDSFFWPKFSCSLTRPAGLLSFRL